MPAQLNTNQRIRFGDFELDLRAGELRKGGARLRLQEQPLKILVLLLEQPGEVVTREQLQKRLWPSDTFVDFEDGLNTAVKKLRDALGDSAEEPRFIETLPKRGYRFVQAVNPVSPQGLQPPVWWRRRTVTGALLLVFLLIGALALNVGGVRNRVFGVRSAGPVASLAMLPCSNLTGDAEREYLADGMTDELTTRLAQIRSLRVPGLATTMRFKGARKSISEIAREMHVDAVVECSLAGTKERIRVRIQLIDARNDAHLWAENFDRDTGDILVFYSEAGVAIADQLRIRLTQPERNRLASSRPVVPEAYEAYLKGRELHWAKITEEGHLKSIEYYQRAVEKDPTYAPAYAGLARAYMFLRQLYEPKEMRPKALAAAAKAIELDPTLAEPHTWLAQLREDERDWAAAEAEHRRALELGPGQASPHLFYAQFLNLVSRHEEALAEIRRAEQLDPLSAFTATNVIHRLIALRRFDEALRQAEKSLELDPNLWLTHFYIGRTYSELGQLEDATAAWEKAASLPGSYHWPLGELIRAYMRLEKKDEALRTLARWETDAKRRKPHPPALPKMYAIVGKREEAMVMLQGAYRRGDLTARQLQDPEISSLRSDPRFQELLRRTGTSLPKKK